MNLKIVLNEDKEHVELVRRALKENKGYCPCMITQSEDTKCMCKNFRKQETPGFCHCGLYKKVEV